MTRRTLSETLAPQLELLTKAAAMIDTYGFAVTLVGPPERHDRAYPTIVEGTLFGFFSGGMDKFIEEWERLNGRRVVRIRVRKDNNVGSIYFWFSVPNRKRFWPLIAALDLFSVERKGRRGEVKGIGFLTATKMSERYEYTGKSRDALKAVVGVLSMPHHREILKYTRPS